MNDQKWIRFFKVCPGGNTTLLLERQEIKASARAGLATALMNPLSLGAEQVGFIDWPDKARKGDPVLQMMGNEFCANAVRAYAGVLATQSGEAPALPWRGRIKSSGLPEPVNAYVCEETYLDAAIEVPLANGISITPINKSGVPAGVCNNNEPGFENGAIVRLPGITHILLPGIPDHEISSDGSRFEIDRDLMLSACNWRRDLKLERETAVGCIWFDLKRDSLAILPLVWVRATNTNCLETSCGSGTLALALFMGLTCGMAGSSNPEDSCLQGVHSPPYASYTNFYHIGQPSGESLWVSYNLHKMDDATLGSEKNVLDNVWLGGPCRILARGDTLI